ncbi:MAG: zinc-dependent metalloprotease [Actinomycetota bacterium]|nr:zinc-dependent metalloprotease [Actinomycetota bacterium]MEC8923806.1 zinc-dependent metalloprotease [Actinomycetota bacterium]
MTDGPVDWELARRLARKVAGDEPLSCSYLGDSLREDFARFTPLAEELVAAETGLVSDEGSARARVIDRAGWIDANIRAFRRLLRPVLAESASTHPASVVTSKIAAAELGMVLGWMSRRVLGQYDLLLTEDEDRDDQDLVYYVGPNILSIEKKFAFDPKQFRLWLALHELTHRSQFTGVPWLRPRFLELVNQMLDEVEPDPDRIKQGLQEFIKSRREGSDPLGDGGLAQLFASERQRELLDCVGGLMSLVEGHGDVTMSRAATGHVPHAARFHRVMHERRNSATGFTRIMQRFMGIEAKLAQYQAGEDFIAAIESERGSRAVDVIWHDPNHLPSMAEIRDPDAWMRRVPAA